MRNLVGGGLALLALLAPLGVGYATAPCDPFTERPVALAPYRLQQQRFLAEARAFLAELTAAATTLGAIAAADAPQSLAEGFTRAGRVSSVQERLNQLQLETPSATYALLAERLYQTRDAYLLAAEALLDFFGAGDPQQRQQARAALTTADATRADLANAVAGLTLPLCREVWREP